MSSAEQRPVHGSTGPAVEASPSTSSHGATRADHEPGMSLQQAVPQTFCRACGTRVDHRASICPSCGVAQTGAQHGGTTEQKSPGLAIFLSFIWPGVGHLYAGRDTEKGIVFTCISGLCFLLSWTIIGLIITVPVWFGTAVYTMIDVNRVMKRQNRAVG